MRNQQPLARLDTVTERPDRQSNRMVAASTETRASLLSMLHCPYCGSALEPDSDSERLPAGDYGILRCGCYEYPVVYGIPILQQLDGIGRVVELIRRGEDTRALLRALRIFRITWAHRSVWHQARYYLHCQRLVSNHTLTFEEAAHLVRRPKVLADYLVNRYANPNFLAAIGPLMLLEHAGVEREERIGPARVLDLACGAGHASFLMQLLHPKLAVIAADQDFVSLYLAKRFLAPDAVHVCWDVEAPSPFPSGYFDAVFCLDAFHYFKAKTAVVSELRRVATADALWLFPHLHNRLQHNLVAGTPLSPEKYLECFGFADARLFDEAEILHQLSQRRVVDFGKRSESSQLAQAKTLTFVRGGRDVWKTYDRFPSALCSDPSLLTINPIYQGTWRAGQLDLQLSWPNDTIRQECSDVTAVLPSRCSLREEDLRQIRDRTPAPDGDHLRDLVASFVLVPLPPRYRRTNLAVAG
jgi:SAM-dependent methyltransferase